MTFFDGHTGLHLVIERKKEFLKKIQAINLNSNNYYISILLLIVVILRVLVLQLQQKSHHQEIVGSTPVGSISR